MVDEFFNEVVDFEVFSGLKQADLSDVNGLLRR